MKTRLKMTVPYTLLEMYVKKKSEMSYELIDFDFCAVFIEQKIGLYITAVK